MTDRLVGLEIPRIGDSEDAYGRTLAYVFIDTDRDGVYEHLYNEDLIELGLARTTTFYHAHRREFERTREGEEERARDCGAPVPKWPFINSSPPLRWIHARPLRTSGCGFCRGGRAGD